MIQLATSLYRRIGFFYSNSRGHPQPLARQYQGEALTAFHEEGRIESFSHGTRLQGLSLLFRLLDHHRLYCLCTWWRGHAVDVAGASSAALHPPHMEMEAWLAPLVGSSSRRAKDPALGSLFSYQLVSRHTLLASKICHIHKANQINATITMPTT